MKECIHCSRLFSGGFMARASYCTVMCAAASRRKSFHMCPVCLCTFYRRRKAQKYRHHKVYCSVACYREGRKIKKPIEPTVPEKISEEYGHDLLAVYRKLKLEKM